MRVELLDDEGRMLQRLSFNATATVPASGGGCDITIGKGGTFEKLDSDLLAKLLEEHGPVGACICFLPGTHDIGALKADGRPGPLEPARLRLMPRCFCTPIVWI